MKREACPKQLKLLTKDLHEYYTYDTTSDYRVGVGTFCAAKSVKEENWCRVHITSVDEDDVDDNIESDDVSNVQSLQNMFALLQTQAVTRRLNGVMPSDNVRGEDGIILFSICHSCLFSEVTDVTTSDGAYAVSLLDTGMSVAQKMTDDQVAATTKKQDTVTLDRSIYDKELDVVRFSDAPLKPDETLEFVVVMPLVLSHNFWCQSAENVPRSRVKYLQFRFMKLPIRSSRSNGMLIGCIYY